MLSWSYEDSMSPVSGLGGRGGCASVLASAARLLQIDTTRALGGQSRPRAIARAQNQRRATSRQNACTCVDYGWTKTNTDNYIDCHGDSFDICSHTRPSSPRALLEINNAKQKHNILRSEPTCFWLIFLPPCCHFLFFFYLFRTLDLEHLLDPENIFSLQLV